MNEESLLGIDIGTSSTKAVLTRPDGQVIAKTVRPHRLSMPRPGWAEHDADKTWWRDVVSVCRELAPVAGSGLRGVCVSGIGPCVVPCDDRLRPLRPAILYGIDTRASNEIDELDRRLGTDAILQRGGSALSSQALGPKLLWISRHEPSVWQDAAGWYMASSFIAARLTGAYVLDHHSASQCNPLYDLDRRDWARDWAADVAPGIDLPELVWPSDQIGSVSAAAAAETGLPIGTPVVAGTIDAWAEAFSAGVRNAGDLMLMYGSTMFLIQIAEGHERHPLLWATAAAQPGSHSLAAGMSAAGLLTEWVRGLVGNPSWEELVADAAASPPGSRGLLLLPYFAGERTPIYDPHARGVLAGLTLSHGPGDILRAAYEGTAYGVRQILELLQDAGSRPERVVAVGGGTHSNLWLQIISDVTGIAQHVPQETIGAAYGDALLAAIGTELVPSETDWATPAATVEPDKNTNEIYKPFAELHAQLYLQTADAVHRLGGLSAPAHERGDQAWSLG